MFRCYYTVALYRHPLRAAICESNVMHPTLNPKNGTAHHILLSVEV